MMPRGQARTHFPHRAQFAAVLIRENFRYFLISSENSFSGQAEMQRPQPLHFSGSAIIAGLKRMANVSFPIAAAPAVSICCEGQGGAGSIEGMKQ